MTDEKLDEKSFTPEFLALCTELELCQLQHELRQFPEDKKYLDEVLGEMSKRLKRRGLGH